MKQQRKTVSDLRSLMKEMQPATAQSPESEAWRAFQYHSVQTVVPPLEQTPRARMQRAINHIARRFSWGPETVAHFLDTRGATYLADLTDPQLEDLHDRMLAYEDSAMHGFSSPDEPPAI